jgi:hypothetical protein
MVDEKKRINNNRVDLQTKVLFGEVIICGIIHFYHQGTQRLIQRYTKENTNVF